MRARRAASAASVGVAVALLVAVVGASRARAQDAGIPAPSSAGVAVPEAPPPPTPPSVYLELPLVDVPFVTANGGAAPSMEQSLWVTADLYQLMHVGIGRLANPYAGSWGQRLLGQLGIVAADVVTLALPGFLAWHHEEWHRAVMSWRGMSSFDDVYELNVFSSVINVSHVSDEDLIRLKAEHPADQVRMSTAGIEANYAGAHVLEGAAFFQGTRSWNTFLYWLLYLQNTAYMSACASTDSDSVTAEEQRREGADVARRDFTGLDCNGWTYDLFRPDEPYQARGIHPSGVGIDRYRHYSAMAPEEQDYLRRQAKLSWLNFLDPNLVGVTRIEWPGSRRRSSGGAAGPAASAPLEFNLAVRHLPAAFGSDVRLDLYLRRGDAFGALLSLHGYFNRDAAFPGVEVALPALPGRAAGHLAGAPLRLGLRAAAWRQPERLRFDSTTGAFGGLAAARLAWEVTRGFVPYLDVEAKTAGWVAGNVFLDRNASLRVGAVARF